MTIYYFDSITKDHSFLGGKGFTLGLMKNAGFPVPDGLILDEIPTNDETWNEIFKWWEKNQKAKLAIRSSAIGEDSSEQSFAGQNSTYLNVDSAEEIKIAIKNCFQSIFKSSSTLYREHFLKEKARAQMNVVLQVMVDPLYSGVFFSCDPRSGEKAWIIEAIAGLGEDLVSGKKTPLHYEENKTYDNVPFPLLELAKIGIAVKEFFATEIDMEWAFDKKGNLQVLQARPVTALSGKSEEKRYIDQELKRLKALYPLDTIWDGGTFAEWSAPPTELSFALWRKAFAKDNAFSQALKRLGYLGIEQELKNPDHSLLERVFYRAHVNISMLAPLYFGPIPYRLEVKKNARLKFDFSKMTFKTFILTPFTMWRMLKVGIQLSTQRSTWLSECAKELTKASNQTFRNLSLKPYENVSNEELLETFKKETEDFYKSHLEWSLVLITLIESTRKNLVAMLKGVYERPEIDRKINEWLSHGLETVTMEMNLKYKEASSGNSPELKENFLKRYGHRGPGELELSHPRWIELGDKAFISSGVATLKKATKQLSVDEEILGLKTYKKEVILKEWKLLKEMLELREKWKMKLLYPYAHIRFLSLEIGKRFNLGDEIFWFNDDEILSLNFNLELAQKRKANATMAKNISLPTLLEFAKLEDLLTSKSSQKDALNGLALSPGLVYGEVRVITNPERALEDLNQWPENTILVAESTDPGWTGLFLKSKAIVVSKGGVLSHCAIVAREMGLPAVSEIKQCHLRFKDGDKIWVDGNNGRITLAH